MLAWFKKEMDKMIEFEIDKERNLKNLKQIGTPKEENKIYVEHMVYAKLKENSYREKRAFVLMGHTERMEGKYVTFIEGIIPIREIYVIQVILHDFILTIKLLELCRNKYLFDLSFPTLFRGQIKSSRQLHRNGTTTL